MKFDYIEQYESQQEQRQSDFDELVRRESSALEEVHALKAEYERVLKESLASRTDATTELDTLQDRIEAAQRTFERRREERNMYSSVVKPEISAQDVVDKFNNEFIPAFKQERLTPVLDRLLAAKQELIDAVMEYHSTVKEFENERFRTRGELSDSYYYKLRSVEPQQQAEFNHYFVTDWDIHKLARGERPDFNKERKIN